jgi:TolB-like protein
MEPQRLALLALLALHPKRKVSRKALTDFLWPTRDAEQARQALNQSLFAISKALGDDAVFPSAKEVRLGAQVSVDALEFESALEAGRAEDAMRLYTAPLMDGFEVEDAPEFQRWAATQRSRFAAAARTQRPVAETAATEDLHDLSDPEMPEPTPDVAPAKEAPVSEAPATEAPAVEAPPSKERRQSLLGDFGLLAEPELESHVEKAPEGPELRAKAAPEPELMTNAVPVEDEPVVSAPPAEPALMTNAVPFEEPAASAAPPPQEEVQWITPNEPASAPPEAAAAASPPASSPEPQKDVSPRVAPPAPVESKPADKPAKKRRRKLPLPSTKVVVALLVLGTLGAFGYMARGWGSAARGGVAVAREGIEAVRGRAEAARLAREKTRSIAVLPIEYSGRNQADAALAARIVEELGPMLTRAGLLVAPSNALTRGKPPHNLRLISDSLNVAHILHGMMQREGAVVAFRFRLLNPVDGSTRWEDTYRPRLADIQVLEEDVAAMVGAQILRSSGDPE